jgi:DNA-binding MarR family transcriptional regulator
MKDELTQDLIHALFCFKRVSTAISRTLLKDNGDRLTIAELSALGCIGVCTEHDCDAAKQTTHHAMHETLAVSKAAVSQMLGSLEKRGYIQRETDKDNRRKIVITLTQKGKVAVDTAGKNMDALMSLIITRFGEHDSRTFVDLLDRFAVIVDEVVS